MREAGVNGPTIIGRVRLMEHHACPSCGAVFGSSLREYCERANLRGLRCCRFACGACLAKLVASIDNLDRLTITLDTSGNTGEYPIITPFEPGGA